MNVGFGTTALNKSSTNGGIDGIGVYCKELRTKLSANSSLNTYSLSFTHSDNQSEETNLGSFKNQLLAGIFFGRTFRCENKLRDSVDLFHSTDHYVPKFSSLPVVATIHDMIPFEYPEWFNPLQRKYHVMMGKSFSWADHIITVSNYSKQSIMDKLEICSSKVSVVYNGVDDRWYKEKDTNKLSLTKLKFHIDEPYLIFVGTLQKRKNLDVVLRALHLLEKEHVSKIKLIIIGKRAKYDSGTSREFEKALATGRAQWLEHVKYDELITLVKGAQAMVFPSLAEGFGLPIIEAFAAGTPVITSNATCIPEIAEDAALMFPPLCENSLKNHIKNILSDDILKDNLILAGLRRAEAFSWKKCSSKTIEIYNEVIEKNKNEKKC